MNIHCPFFVASASDWSVDTLCLREKCGFYETQKGVCAIVAIAAELAHLRENIEEMKKYI
ncbi:hypothetical protein [Sporolituus thermophilus]|uniref:Uncharacterized protein n=1 Tax=Sporolituus thermophilus DSM 23256 TaxID=1123285 RepID=A0A1G7K3N1_9FIRM|nr:hypothetical protein [Sporolituus thermophilus]SDF31732.1 hypothetical protein SAMN05660235_01158 [Sporolituus thermophilus DSM 23256]